MAEPTPRVDRPFIKGYGVPESLDGTLGWPAVVRAISSSPRYWISTTNEDGSPHVIQQWGGWVEGALYFEGGPETRWARNLARDPRVAVAVERAGLTIMVNGPVHDLKDPERALARKVIAAYGDKYPYKPSAKNWVHGGLIAVRPARVFAWRVRDYPKSATRFTFARDDR